jgi:NADPH:quinone reductase
MMRAVVFDRAAPDASASRVADVALPEPGPGQIAVDVACAGVNFIDIMARRGDPGYASEWPFVPGLEIAGTVRALGPGVEQPAPGARVAAFVGRGGLAEVALAPAALVAEIPDGVDFARAAAAGGALTTAALLLEHVARVRAGDVVLVHSAGGGVGQALAQLAPLSGAARIVGTVGRPERVASARAAGYDAVLVREHGLAQALREETGGHGADVILDPQGTDLLELDLELAAPGARIVLFGNAAGGALGPLPAAGALFAGNAMIGGFSLSRMSTQLPERVGGALRDVLTRLAEHQIDVELHQLEGLEAAPHAHDELAAGRGSGKRVVRVSDAHMRSSPATS